MVPILNIAIHLAIIMCVYFQGEQIGGVRRVIQLKGFAKRRQLQTLDFPTLASITDRKLILEIGHWSPDGKEKEYAKDNYASP